MHKYGRPASIFAMDARRNIQISFLALACSLSNIGYAQPCGLDLYVANDQSGSVSSSENWQSRQFISAMMNGMQPWGSGPGESRMAIADWSSPGQFIQFNYPSVGQNYSYLLSDVLAYQNASRVLNAGTDPYTALLAAYQGIAQTPVPGRAPKQVIVLMTDAACSQIPAGITNLATQIKNSGVFVIVVAIEAAASCTELMGTNVASPGAYFSAGTYYALMQANAQLVHEIISTACTGSFDPSYDLAISLDNYTATNCNVGGGTFTVNYTVTNNSGAPFNGPLLISYYNGDPTLPTTALVAMQNVGVQNLPIGGTYSGSLTNPIFAYSANLFAIVNYDGSVVGQAPPVPPFLFPTTFVADEYITVNNFSNGLSRVGDASCPPYAVITGNVVSGGVGCNDLVAYNITICNTGEVDAFINATVPIPAPGAVLVQDVNYDGAKVDTLEWATYYGGAAEDLGYRVATDASGFIYMTGTTSSATGIATAGAHRTTLAGGTDAFLVKFNPNGTRVWGTYYGGTAADQGFDVAVDNTGNVYMVGTTSSTTNIATAGTFQTAYLGGQDAFIVKFNSAGVRQWGSYYASTEKDIGQAVATDAAGNVYLAGYTEGTTLWSAGAYQTVFNGTADLFLAKFDPTTGGRLWGTLYGGEQEDIAADVVTDLTGAVYLAGQTQSLTGIATAGSYQQFLTADDDVFLAKFSTTGVRQWATYYGGERNELAPCLARDAAGYIYLGGQTASDFVVALNSSYQNTLSGATDGFLVQFDNAGNPNWGTYIGGTMDDAVRGIATDAAGFVYLTGITTSPDQIASNGSHQMNVAGQDAFLMKFDNTGGYRWGTYYGGAGVEEGYGVATGTGGSIYISGTTGSAANIATTGAFQTAYGGANDAYLAKFNEHEVGYFLFTGDCITRQYIFDFTAVAPGAYNFSLGINASPANIGQGQPLIAPDNNFTVGVFTNISGFNGALHTTDNVVIPPTSPACVPGDKISIAVNIPTTSSCGDGNFVQATVTINNTSGAIAYNTVLHLTLNGAGSTFASELYNITAGLNIPLPSVLDPNYPWVPYALFFQSGDVYLPINSIPPGISTFNVDINMGGSLTDLYAQIENIHSGLNVSGVSNLAHDAQGVSSLPPPDISGFNCPGNINAGSNIVLNGISVTNAASVAWASSSMAVVPNGGSVASPSLTYVPTPLDVANGYVEIGLTAISAAGCDAAVTCQVLIGNVNYDYGDAPVTYDLNVNYQPPAAASTLYAGLNLGTVAPGTELLANNSVMADGDGLEEDGLLSNPYTAPYPPSGAAFNLPVRVTNNNPKKAYLHAYVDWNADGDFLDTLERGQFTDVVNALSGSQSYVMQFTVPPVFNSTGLFYIRLRLSTDSFAVTVPYMAAPQGETEDYVWNSDGPLPLELISFTGVDLGNSVLLTWISASELNCDHYQLERGSDINSFTPIAQLQGAGTTQTVTSYSYVDHDQWTSVAYYRLKEVDMDGSYEYAGPIAVTRSASDRLWIEQLQRTAIHVHGYDPNMKTQVLDMIGRTCNVAPSPNGILDVSTLAHGVYSITFAVEGTHLASLRFVVE